MNKPSLAATAHPEATGNGAVASYLGAAGLGIACRESTGFKLYSASELLQRLLEHRLLGPGARASQSVSLQ